MKVVKLVHESYLRPSKYLFKWVCCPHYFAEIIVYFSMWLINVALSNYKQLHLILLLALAWVTSNLMVVSYQQFLWYKLNTDVPRDWCIILPFVW